MLKISKNNQISESNQHFWTHCTFGHCVGPTGAPINPTSPWLETSALIFVFSNLSDSLFSTFSIWIWLSDTQFSPHLSSIFLKQNFTIDSEFNCNISEICFARVSFETIFLRARALKMKKVFRKRQWPHVTWFLMSSRIVHSFNKLSSCFLKHRSGLHKYSQVSSLMFGKFNSWVSMLVSTCWWSRLSALYKWCLKIVKFNLKNVIVIYKFA